MIFRKVFPKRTFLFGLTFVFFSTLCLATTPVTYPVAQKGVIDLRNENFKNESRTLQGEWEFYWHQLVAPGQKKGVFEFAQFPVLWSSSTWKGKPLSSEGYATYRLMVLLPHNREPLGFKILHSYCSYRLYNGTTLIAADGRVGVSKETTTPYWSTQIRPLNTTRDTLYLTLQIANFHHSKGGMAKPIEVGRLADLQVNTILDHAFDFFLTGGVFMAGLFFLGLYLFGRHDKSIFYFSMFCFFYSYRIIGTSQYALHSVFPTLGWDVAIHCEYLSLFIAVAMFVLYTRSLYPEDAPQDFMLGMAFVSIGFGVITLVFPPMVFTKLVNPFLALVNLYIAFAVYIYWIAVKNKRIGSQYALMSTVAIFIVVVSIILEYYGIAAPQKALLFVGYISFFFCQSLILSFRFAFTLKQAKEEAEMGLKIKAEFLSTMSHEIRTPLNSILGMTHLMLREAPRPDQREHLDILLFSGQHLLALVNDILDFNIIEAGKIRFNYKPMDLIGIARNIVSGYQSSNLAEGIKLLLDIDERVPASVLGDTTRTSQIISNLVHNAVKFTTSGWVKLKIEVVDKSTDQVSLRISVEDTGIGIPEDKLKIIFDRFTQVDSSSSRGFSGTGLGLAISKRILELQGINLRVESEVDKGSVFYFVQRFTILENVQPSLPEVIVEQSDSDNPSLRDVPVLVVEDNQMNVLLIQSFLKKWGAIPDVATNGKEALERLDLQRHRLVLMDLHMPVMDGYEATQAIRQLDGRIPVIALTADISQDVEEKVKNAGINAIVIKPFNPDELLKVMLSWLKQR